MHRHLALLTVVSLGIHIGALMLDGYTKFAVADVAVPFHSAWKPTAVAWGVISMWIIAVVQTTSLAKNRIPARAWKIIHRTSMLAYILSTMHFLQAGSERLNPIVRVSIIAMSATAAILLSFRLLADKRLPRRAPPKDVAVLGDR
jgi:predicted ferric reductase